jgi:hypothetical protein
VVSTEPIRIFTMKRKAIEDLLRAALTIGLLALSSCGAAMAENKSIMSGADCGRSSCVNNEPNARIALVSPGDVSTRGKNDYLNQCGEQARMTYHEIENCRAVTVLAVPLDQSK